MRGEQSSEEEEGAAVGNCQHSLNGRHFLPDKASSAQTEKGWKASRRSCSSLKQSTRIYACPRAPSWPAASQASAEPSPEGQRLFSSASFWCLLHAAKKSDSSLSRILVPYCPCPPFLWLWDFSSGNMTRGQTSVPYSFA